MHSVKATAAFPHLRLTHPRVPPPASLGVSDAVTHASGRPRFRLAHEYSKCLSLCTARHSHAQLPKFKQTCSALISTISTYHSGCVRGLNLPSLSADDRRAIFLLSCCRLPAFSLFIYFFYPDRNWQRHLIFPETLFYGGLSRRPPLAYSEITQ